MDDPLTTTYGYDVPDISSFLQAISFIFFNVLEAILSMMIMIDVINGMCINVV